jgi:hypothetical protein
VPALDIDRARPHNNVPYSIGKDSMCQDCRGAGTVTNRVAGLLRRLTEHAGAPRFSSIRFYLDLHKHSLYRLCAADFACANADRLLRNLCMTQRYYSSATRFDLDQSLARARRARVHAGEEHGSHPDGTKVETRAKRKDAERQRPEAALEEGLEETSPASNVVAVTEPRRRTMPVRDLELGGLNRF